MVLEWCWVQAQKLQQPTDQQSSDVWEMVVLLDLDAIEVSSISKILQTRDAHFVFPTVKTCPSSSIGAAAFSFASKLIRIRPAATSNALNLFWYVPETRVSHSSGIENDEITRKRRYCRVKKGGKQ